MPETIPGLVADFDLSSPNYLDYLTLNGDQVALWVPRAGAYVGMGGLAQGTSVNQPKLVTASEFGGQRALQFTSNDQFLRWSGNASDWTFLHDGSGATTIIVERIDSTGGNDQYVLFTTTASTVPGVIQLNRLASLQLTVHNGAGGGTSQNSFTNTELAHRARDVSRWRAWTYELGEQASMVSGSRVSGADTAGQSPSTSAPQVGLSLGRATNSLKGLIARLLVYNRVLTDDEINDVVAPYLADTYGVAA